VQSFPRLTRLHGIYTLQPMRETTRQLIVARATAFFDIQPPAIYSRSQLAEVFSLNRADWRLRHFGGFGKTVRFLVENTPFCEFQLHSERYGDKFRYAWGNCSPYRLGLSLKTAAFLSHGTAAHLHGLTKDLQESIDRAFQHVQRRSNYILSCNDWLFILLNGKNSGRLGVATVQSQEGFQVEVTDLERTLIDLTVRPSYAGGVRVVLEAYEQARPRVCVDKLFDYLQRLDYVYPYHQAVGFYMQHAGYSTAQISQLKGLGLGFNFYLTHAMKDPKFDLDWKIFYPTGLLRIH
jgi:hypothetical protein